MLLEDMEQSNSSDSDLGLIKTFIAEEDPRRQALTSVRYSLLRLTAIIGGREFAV